MFDNEIATGAKLEAIELFSRAYRAQMQEDYETAIELYKESIETYPTAEAHTFLGWTYSFQGRFDDAIEECLAAIGVDPTLGNPYNDIGSYLIAKGDLWSCVRWFKLAMKAERYEARAFPYFNLARVYEQRGKWIEAAKNYELALNEQPDYLTAMKALRRLQTRLN
jgi:tetratricopeptide (TPR) repeat protein